MPAVFFVVFKFLVEKSICYLPKHLCVMSIFYVSMELLRLLLAVKYFNLLNYLREI